MNFSYADKEWIQTDHESRETADKEIEPIITSSNCPPIKELKENCVK